MDRKQKLEHSQYWRDYNNKLEDLSVCAPKLFALAADRNNGFRGLTVFEGDDGRFVMGIKRWGEDSEAQVIWTSAEDWVLLWLSAERALSRGKWKKDKSYRRPS